MCGEGGIKVVGEKNFPWRESGEKYRERGEVAAVEKREEREACTRERGEISKCERGVHMR